MSGWSKSFKTIKSGLQRGQSTIWGEAHHCELSAFVSQVNLSIFQHPGTQSLQCMLPRRYPYNLDFDFSALEGLQKFSINNLGDPFIESNYGVHSREFEVSYGPSCSPWGAAAASG